MKPNFSYKIIFLFLILFIPFSLIGNTDSYYKELVESVRKEYAAKNYARSLEILTEMKAVSEQNNWPERQIQSLNFMGLVYKDLSDYDKAIECFLKGYEVAISSSNERQQMMILNNISEIYYVNEDIDKSREYLERGYKIAMQMQDSLMMGKFAANLGLLANANNELNLAENYLDISLAMLKNQKEKNILLKVQEEKVRNLYLRGRYSRAEQLGLEMLEKLPLGEDDHVRSRVLLLLSQINEKNGNLKDAIHFVKKSLDSHPRLATKIEAYEQLSHLYRDNNNSLALLYQDSVLSTKDSLAKLNDMSQVKNNQIRFDLLNSEKELTESKAKQRAERTLFIFLIVFVVFLSLILIWVLNIQSIRNKQRKLITELELEKEKNEKLLLEQQLKEQEILSILEQERLGNEIETKNKQLTAKVLFQSSRNELIKELIATLSEVPDRSENTALEPIIHKLKMQLKDSADIDNFLVNFEQINPSLFSLLKEKFPDLTVNDIRLLSYIYLYLDIKKIAHLLNISVEACRKRRERLSAKLEVKTTDLYDYLVDIIKTSLET
jgi:tetratricopeptide (TPR) repeat protein